MSDETTLLVPGSGSHKAPTRGRGVSYLRGNVSKNELKSKPTSCTPKKKKKDPLFFLCQKLWTCWFSILRAKLLIYFFLLINPDEQL